MIIPYFLWLFSAPFILSKRAGPLRTQTDKTFVKFRETSVCECGKRNTITSRIVGGKDTQPHEHPWMTLILNKGNLHCGGTLINDRYILTAGHCLRWVEKEHLGVYLAVHDSTHNSTVKPAGFPVEVEYILPHGKFKSFEIHDVHDIGLIKLRNPVKFNEKMSPICLPKRKGETYANETAQVTGWGKTSKSGTASKNLKEVSVTVMSKKDCKKVPVVGKLVLNSMLCAYRKKADACQGDSGGPIIFETKSGKVEQIGVVSWGVGCATPGMPGVYTRVTSYLPWISRNTKDAIYCKNPA